jgi:hypothetical protein
MREAPSVWTLMIVTGLLLAGCGSDDNKGECDLANPRCDDGLVCEAQQGTTKGHCYAPLIIKGVVLDALDDSPIQGALVQAVDPNDAAVGTTGTSGSDGKYTITVPALRTSEGTPVSLNFTLRSQAAGYEAFPSAIRTALPLDAATAVKGDDGWVLEGTLTTLKLLPIEGDTTGLGSISGTVLSDDHAGVLVVAEAGAAGLIGFSDAEGDYTIFNVPAGTYTVAGYKAGVQLVPATTTLAASEEKAGVDLTAATTGLATVSGSVNIVNAPGGSLTSVVLAVESTFVENAARGVVPPGLRVGDISNAFTIPDVPDGKYVVLAAFENDGLVRDPDPNIAGTQIVHITVDAATSPTVTLADNFKVTEALAILSPGANGIETITTPTPTFTFADDSSEDEYHLWVFDAYGNEIWTVVAPKVTGSNVEVVYAGPALEANMIYQFKVNSIKAGAPISATEDLKGVFTYVP